MIRTILTYSQPMAIGIFIVSGICCFLVKPIQLNQGIINCLFGIVNFFIFYGSKFIK